MVNPILVGESLSSSVLQQTCLVKTLNDLGERQPRRQSSQSSARNHVSRRHSYRRSQTGEKSRTSVGEDESMQHEWRSKTTSQLTLASSVQDNLLEEVFKLQAALDNANSRLTAALTQNDLLQYDLNEAQNEIKTRDKTCKDLRSEATLRAKDHNLALSQTLEDMKALETKLEVAKKVEERYSRTIATQKRDIEFLEEVQYQLEGDIRELKTNLEEANHQLKDLHTANKIAEASLVSKEVMRANADGSLTASTRHDTQVHNIPIHQRDSYLMSGHRASIASTLANGSPGRRTQTDRRNLALSISSCLSQESLQTVNSVATPSLANEANDWLEHVPETSAQDDESFSQRPLHLAAKSLGQELEAINDEILCPGVVEGKQNVVDSCSPEEHESQGQMTADALSATAVSDPTSVSPRAEYISVGVQTEYDYVSLAAEWRKSLRLDESDMARSSTTSTRAKIETTSSVSSTEDDATVIEQCDDDDDDAVGEDVQQLNIGIKRPRTSHLFEVVDHEGNTEMKFCRVDQLEQNMVPGVSHLHPTNGIQSDSCTSSSTLAVPINVPVRRASLSRKSKPIVTKDTIPVPHVINTTKSIQGKIDRHVVRTTKSTGSLRPTEQPHNFESSELRHQGSISSTVLSRCLGLKNSIVSLTPQAALRGSTKVVPTQTPPLASVETHAAQLTRTMIGTEMYKYIRQGRSISLWSGTRRRDEEVVQRHRRYVMLRPMDGTICWSSSRPAGKVLGFKKCYITEVYDVEDNSAPADGITLHDRSLLIISEGKTLRFTALNAETHQLWYSVMIRLLQECKRTATPGSRTIVPGSSPMSRRARRKRASTFISARPDPIKLNRPSLPELSILRVRLSEDEPWDLAATMHNWRSSYSQDVPGPGTTTQSLVVPETQTPPDIATCRPISRERRAETPNSTQRKQIRREVSMNSIQGIEHSFAAFVS